MAWDNVLYDLAKYLGIKTLFVEKTMIIDRVLVMKDYRKVNKVPSDYLTQIETDDIADIVGENLIQEVFKTSGWINLQIKKI